MVRSVNPYFIISFLRMSPLIFKTPGTAQSAIAKSESFQLSGY